jgi:hypothetical protein
MLAISRIRDLDLLSKPIIKSDIGNVSAKQQNPKPEMIVFMGLPNFKRIVNLR